MTRSPRDERLESWLSVASELFGSKGFNGTTIDDIGAALGLSGPALYRRVSSKQAILAKLAERGYGQVIESIDDVTSREQSPAATLLATIRIYVRSALADIPLAAVMLREIRHLDGNLAVEVRGVQGEYVQRLRTAVMKARPELSQEEASLLVSGFGGLISTPIYLTIRLAQREREDLLVRAALIWFGVGRGR